VIDYDYIRVFERILDFCSAKLIEWLLVSPVNYRRSMNYMDC